jgi:AraC-like DNA-binding protein
LFNNVFEVPSITFRKNEASSFSELMEKMEKELGKNDFWTEEMARTLLKQLVIMASRSWVKANSELKDLDILQTELSRKFSQLVEQYFTSLHSVADYANLLHVSPKTLNRKIVDEKKTSPNTIIKDRIILQAKRLLAHTQLSINSATRNVVSVSEFLKYNKIISNKDSRPIK